MSAGTANSKKIVASSVSIAPALKRVHSIHPWEIQHHDHYSSIRAYVEITGQFETIVVAQGINHVAVAELIVALANAHNEKPVMQTTLDYRASKR